MKRNHDYSVEELMLMCGLWNLLELEFTGLAVLTAKGGNVS